MGIYAALHRTLKKSPSNHLIMKNSSQLPHRKDLSTYEKYGDLSQILRDRASVLGQDLTVSGSGMITEIEERGKMASHFRIYRRTILDFPVKDIRSLVSLYRINLEPSPQNVHVIWVFSDYGKSIKSHIGYLEEAGLLKDDDNSVFGKVPDYVLKKVIEDPLIYKRINEALVEAYAEALSFYNWKHPPRGIVVSNLPRGIIATVRPYNFADYGNDGLGVAINFPAVLKLFMGSQMDNTSALRENISPIFVHEIAHMHNHAGRDGESMPICAELILAPGNANNINMLLKFVDNIRNIVTSNKRLESYPYERDVYAGLVLAMDMYAKVNPEIKSIFNSDRSKYKLNSIAKALHVITKEDEIKAKEMGLIDKLLSLSTAQVNEEFESAAILLRR